MHIQVTISAIWAGLQFLCSIHGWAGFVLRSLSCSYLRSISVLLAANRTTDFARFYSPQPSLGPHLASASLAILAVCNRFFDEPFPVIWFLCLCSSSFLSFQRPSLWLLAELHIGISKILWGCYELVYSSHCFLVCLVSLRIQPSSPHRIARVVILADEWMGFIPIEAEACTS